MDGYNAGSNKNLDMLKEIDNASEKISFGIANKDKNGTSALSVVKGNNGLVVASSVLQASSTHRLIGEKAANENNAGYRPLRSR